MLLYNELKLDLKCYICKEVGHVAVKCSQLRIIHDRKEINQQLCKVIKRFQTNFKRNEKRKTKWKNTLKILKKTTIEMITFRFKYKYQIDFFCLQYSDVWEQIVVRQIESEDESKSGSERELALRRSSYLKGGFKSLAVQMLAVNDMIDLQDYEMERAKKEYKDYKYFQKLQEFERIQNYSHYFVHNNLN